jgi:hypothetical protein
MTKGKQTDKEKEIRKKIEERKKEFQDILKKKAK